MATLPSYSELLSSVLLELLELLEELLEPQPVATIVSARTNAKITENFLFMIIFLLKFFMLRY